MNIIESEHEADSYYLRTGDVEPDLRENGLEIYNGNNHKSGNKWCKVENIIIHNDDRLTSVLCTWTCRHSGGQFWRHYVDGQRKNWKQLNDSDRMMILDGYDELAPCWANVPGKLTRDYLKPNELRKLEIDEQGTIYGYKYLRLEDGNFYSIASVSKGVEWPDMEIEADRIPAEDNTNGIYAMKSAKNPGLNGYYKTGRVLVRLALSGVVVEANEGMRAQHAQIVEVLK